MSVLQIHECLLDKGVQAFIFIYKCVEILFYWILKTFIFDKYRVKYLIDK